MWPYNEVLATRCGLLVILCGPSASGKDAVIGELAATGFPFRKIVTVTTRLPRPEEVPGRDYHFLSLDEFAQWREAGKLLEWSMVYGTPYGTPLDPVREALAAGETVLLKTDVQGAAKVRQRVPNAISIFLGPGSFAELQQRLNRRNTESDADFQRRIDEARSELRELAKFDYLVINRQGQLACAVEQVRAIMIAERLRVQPRPIRL